jgi:hypothetical protein
MQPRDGGTTESPPAVSSLVMSVRPALDSAAATQASASSAGIAYSGRQGSFDQVGRGAITAPLTRKQLHEALDPVENFRDVDPL